MGLGHLRRNLLIAQTLAGSELRATCLMISGAHETNFFSLPEGVDCLTLPRVYKNGRGKYVAANLNVSISELSQIRQESICAALEQFAPDILIVDKVPVGARGELLPALRSLAARGHTKCILGIRDILDDSAIVRVEWLNRKNIQAIEDFYETIWIYGDPHVYNAAEEYRFPTSFLKKTHFTGYFDQTKRLAAGRNDELRDLNGAASSQRKKVVCAVGGGQDGTNLVDAFIDAMTPDFDATVLTGPYVPRPAFQSANRAAANRQNLRIVGFTPEADVYIAKADRVVAMAGYNTVCSILSFCRPALLVPRIVPRREQWIRALRLHELKLVDIILPERLTSASLACWLRRPVERATDIRDVVDLNGLDRVVEWVASLLAGNDRLMQAASPITARSQFGEVP
jgi:predicted glycosyltransferase